MLRTCHQTIVYKNSKSPIKIFIIALGFVIKIKFEIYYIFLWSVYLIMWM